MAELKPVLVYDGDENSGIIRTQYMSDENLPETYNGEDGFHVYHVRMLTELILGQLKKNKGDIGLSDKEISDIAIASSLHDIGKMKIPQSILDFNGKLSPLEYDIVKKHSVFGEELIDNAKTDVDPQIIKFAKQIARCHHERIDGTGYPDGAKGADIPLCAQVVSLADAFDALTSERSYKKAFSLDVAIEMIVNGMCGVFDNELTECLMQVVNNEVLVELREKLKKQRSIVQDTNAFVPRNVLLIGNTGYITKSFLQNTFEKAKILIVGESDIESYENVRVFTSKNPPIKQIIQTYDFDLVIYFARELTFDSSRKSDAEELRTLLQYIKEESPNTKFMYFSSLEAGYENKNDRSILAASKESLCEYYANEHALNIKVVRIPYLYSGTYKKDFLFSLFEKMQKQNRIRLPFQPGEYCRFLCMTDLSELIVRMFDNWTDGTGVLTINDDFHISFVKFTDSLSNLKKGVSFELCGTLDSRRLSTSNSAVKNTYGWFSKISIIEDLQEQYENYLEATGGKYDTFADKILRWLKKHSGITKIIEMFVLFFITEVLIKITDSALYFAIVDFRMAFIVIMGTIHGLPYGIASATLSSISWLIAKIASGTNWITIFYEPTNWLAFVFFFLIGALCGYIRLKNDNKISDITEQNKLLENKLVFTRELYGDTFNEKRILKKQIIGSKDSFGKIFDVTRKLDTVEPRKLYLKIMDTFEDILENKSISVYSVNENSAFGRLEVASRDIIQTAARSISLDAYKSITDVTDSAEVWKNTSLTKGMPMYAAGVRRSGKTELLIFIWQAGEDQRSLYYVNLFKILCDLVQMSLLRAYDYNKEIYQKQHINGTAIMTKEAYDATYNSFVSMAERKVFSYIQLEIDCKGHSFDEVNAMLTGKIRTNDVIGDAGDGKLRILLSQAGKEDLTFILPRFEALDIDITVLNK